MDEPRDNTPPQSLFAPWRWNRETWFGIALVSLPFWVYIPAAILSLENVGGVIDDRIQSLLSFVGLG